MRRFANPRRYRRGDVRRHEQPGAQNDKAHSPLRMIYMNLPKDAGRLREGLKGRGETRQVGDLRCWRSDGPLGGWPDHRMVYHAHVIMLAKPRSQLFSSSQSETDYPQGDEVSKGQDHDDELCDVVDPRDQDGAKWRYRRPRESAIGGSFSINELCKSCPASVRSAHIRQGAHAASARIHEDLRAASRDGMSLGLCLVVTGFGASCKLGIHPS